MRERLRFEREIADLDLYGPAPQRERPEGTGRPAPARKSGVAQLMDLIPRKGVAHDIAAVSDLTELFDEAQAQDLATRIRASPPASKLAKQHGLWALVALGDTLGPKGLDVAAAEAALAPRDKSQPLKRSDIDAVIGVGETVAGDWQSAWFGDLRVARMRALGLKGPPPPGSGDATVDTRTSSVSGLDVKVLFAQDSPRNFADAKRDVLLALDHLSKDVAKVKVKTTRQMMQECMGGFTDKDPLRVMVAAMRPDDALADPVTALVYTSDDDVGTPALRRPIIRLPEVFITAATQKGLPLPLMHELIHYHLMRHKAGSDAMRERARPGLALASPARLQRLALWFVAYFMNAQEEVFTFEHVALAFPPLPKVTQGYRDFLTKSRDLFKALGVTLKTDKTKIPAPATGVKWEIVREIPTAFPALRYVDGPRLREMIKLFPTAKV
jgi:hypothetical protein